jgi:hypothetical protein
MKKSKQVLSIIIAVIITISAVSFSAGAVQTYDEWISSSWSSISDSDGYITLTPGSDRTQMNFSWQSSMWKKSASINISTSSSMSPHTELSVSNALNLFAGEYTHEATATNLSSDTVYYYQYKANGSWSSVYSFTTGSESSTKVLFVTDPQIGRSSGDTTTILKNDTYGWTSTIETAVENNSGIDFVLSAGDQVEKAYSEKQYTMFESIPELRSLPVAAVIGNHDFYANNYKYHFNNPNDKTSVSGQSIAGNGYYFSYNDILFIILDSNNTNGAAQEKILAAACKAYPDTKWRVVSMHHSPYDANSNKYPDNVAARAYIAPFLDKYNIDLCLSGHDHYYSRSYIIKNNAVTSDVSKNGTYTNPQGTLYVSGDSASGSHYYGIDESALTIYCDVYFQSRVPEYSIVDFVNNELTVTTYETQSNSVIDQVAIVKD